MVTKALACVGELGGPLSVKLVQFLAEELIGEAELPDSISTLEVEKMLGALWKKLPTKDREETFKDAVKTVRKANKASRSIERDADEELDERERSKGRQKDKRSPKKSAKKKSSREDDEDDEESESDGSNDDDDRSSATSRTDSESSYTRGFRSNSLLFRPDRWKESLSAGHQSSHDLTRQLCNISRVHKMQEGWQKEQIINIIEALGEWASSSEDDSHQLVHTLLVEVLWRNRLFQDGVSAKRLDFLLDKLRSNDMPDDWKVGMPKEKDYTPSQPRFQPNSRGRSRGRSGQRGRGQQEKKE